MNEPGNEMWVGMFWGAVIVLPIAGIVALVYFLAITDSIFTFVKEGEIKAVMVGESLARFLVNVSGYRNYHPTDSDHPANIGMTIDKIAKDHKRLCLPLNTPIDREHVIMPIDKTERKHRNWFNRLGLYYVGWLPGYYKLLWYKFFWQKWQQVGQDRKSGDPAPNKEEEGKYFVKPRQDTVGSLLFQTTYAIAAVDLDLGDNVTVTVTTLVTVRVVYPARTLFRITPTGNWFVFLHSSVIAAIRDFCSTKPFEDIKRGQHEGKESEFEKAVMGVNEQLLERIGVIIVGVDFQKIEFQNLELHRRYQEAGVAEQAGIALQKEATGRAEAIKKVAGAEQERFNKIIPTDQPYAVIARALVLAVEAITQSRQKGTQDKKGGNQTQE